MGSCQHFVWFMLTDTKREVWTYGRSQWPRWLTEYLTLFSSLEAFSSLWMWTVRMVWLLELCSFILWVPIARFFKPSCKPFGEYYKNILLTRSDLKNSHQIIQLPALDAEEIVHHEGPGPLIPPHGQVGPLGTRIEEIYHLDNRNINIQTRFYQGRIEKLDPLEIYPFPRYRRTGKTMEMRTKKHIATAAI